MKISTSFIAICLLGCGACKTISVAIPHHPSLSSLLFEQKMVELSGVQPYGKEKEAVYHLIFNRPGAGTITDNLLAISDTSLSDEVLLKNQRNFAYWVNLVPGNGYYWSTNGSLFWKEYGRGIRALFLENTNQSDPVIHDAFSDIDPLQSVYYISDPEGLDYYQTNFFPVQIPAVWSRDTLLIRDSALLISPDKSHFQVNTQIQFEYHFIYINRPWLHSDVLSSPTGPSIPMRYIQGICLIRNVEMIYDIGAIKRTKVIPADQLPVVLKKKETRQFKYLLNNQMRVAAYICGFHG